MDGEFTSLGPEMSLSPERKVAVAYPKHRIQPKPSFDRKQRPTFKLDFSLIPIY